MSPPFVYLASRSPRRAELLRQLGVEFEIVEAPVDESLYADETAAEYVRRLAHAKVEAARATFPTPPSAPILGADTTVTRDAAVLGKPRDAADAVAMLLGLAERSHQVHSAVAVCNHAGRFETGYSVSRVWFRTISRAEAEAYWRSGEPADKAGGYAIQGRGAVFVERLEGSYSGVMGLPLFETAALLRGMGVKLLDG
ncbi:MAG TPA: Maf family protein [Gammaproteobacteria bacterium]|nr:Maf family protein [Gammaproteobacteria bacterium]